MQTKPLCGVVLTLSAAAALAVVVTVGRTKPTKSGVEARTPEPEPQVQEPFKHTNRLANTTSPYLLQHAHNPVDWYPWGEEALQRAKAENKPIFLSIGYSTCYWCHVMEREVFENEAIAALMNERFVCIKVDREERPDLDEIYMIGTQLMTQGGGWPNSVFLTPNLEPFFAGTYFGATDQNGRPGFGTVVTQLGDAWVNQRDKVNEVSGRVAEAIKSVMGERLASLPKATLDAALVDKAVEEIADAYDPTDGGFGLAPKFPSDFYYSFLLGVHGRRVADGNKDEQTLAMVTRTLDAMAAGGIHDQVGGGFHRYSTDGQWKVPHFEKMLYNQAQLAVAYLDAYAATGEVRYADTARGIFRFVGEAFTGPEGQFYSALDAETDAVEGAYYVWTREQISSVLGDAGAAKFLTVFELADVPTFPGHKHPDGGALVRKSRGETNTAEISAMLDKLARARKTRQLPRLDDKAIAAWNGMMIDAYARGAEVLKDDAYRATAANAATFVLEKMTMPDGRLVRSVRFAADTKAPPSTQEGFLEDYAFVIRGLLELHRVEPDTDQKVHWLDAAKTFVTKADELFGDTDDGGYFFATLQSDLLARSKELGDNATPGGNSVMAHNLIDLYSATREVAYRERAGAVLAAFSGVMGQSPGGSVHMVDALDRFLESAHAASSGTAPSAIGFKVPASDTPGSVATRITDSSAHVKVEASVEPATAAPGETVTVTATLRIEDGWHINANPASADFLIATVVDVRAGTPPGAAEAPAIEVSEITYPAPSKLKIDGLGGNGIDIYDGTARVTSEVRLPQNATRGATIPLRVRVKFQACSEAGVCLAPADWMGEVGVSIKP